MIFSKIKNFFRRISDESERNWREYLKGISESLKPCPICGRKAALIEMIDTEGNYRTWWHVECEDFDDHGAWTLPIRCNFNGAGYWGKGFRESYCPEDAARLWNEVVVPTAIRTKEAMERVKKYDKQEKTKQ